MDYNYEYHYKLKEKFDVAGAVAGIAGTFIGSVAGNMGANPIGGGMTAINGTANALKNAKKGSISETIKYDETIVKSSLFGNNININSGNNANIISSDIISQNSTNLNAANNLNIATAQEEHYSSEYNKKFKTDLTGAFFGNMIGSAMTNATSSVGNNLFGPVGAVIGASASMPMQNQISDFGSQSFKSSTSVNEDKLQIESNIISNNGNVILNTNNDLNISGSNIASVNGSILLNSNSGNINIISSQEEHKSIFKEESRDFNNVKLFDKGYGNKVKSGFSLASINILDRSKTSTTESVIQKASNINSDNDILITNGGNKINNIGSNINKQDINIVASNIISNNGNIDIISKNGKTNILSKENIFNFEETNETKKINLNVGINNNFLSFGDEIANAGDNYQKLKDDDNKYNYLNTFLAIGNTGVGAYNAIATVPTLGFTAKIDLNIISSKTTTNGSEIVNSGSNIVSNNNGNLNILSDDDININGSNILTRSNGNKNNNKENINGNINGNINIISDNGNINIAASKDTSKRNTKFSQGSMSISYDILSGGLSLPTYSYTSQKSESNSTTYNNSDINSENGNINIESKNKDISIKGADIKSKESDINLLAVNGNMDIQSTQNTKYSKTDGTSYSVGGNISYGADNDLSDIITNNYTTIISNNGNTTIKTNDLTLIGIQSEIKDSILSNTSNNNNINNNSNNTENNNKKDTSIIRGSISEIELQEKNKQSNNSYNISYNLPISINTGLGIGGKLNEKVNNLISKDQNGNIRNNKLSNYFNEESSKYQNNFNNTINPDQKNTNTQLPMQVGNWKDSLMNTTLSYKNDNGLDFSGSLNSVDMGGKITWETSKIISDIVGEIPGSPIWVSRKKPIPPHPFPSFGIGDEVMGRASIERDENNKPIIYTDSNGDLYYKDTGENGGILSGSDKNPIFRGLYITIFGGKSMTDNHDIESNRMVKDMEREWLRSNPDKSVDDMKNDKNFQDLKNKKLATSIPISFGTTGYGIFGTLLDFKNYGENYKKIKDSYNNGLNKDIKIKK